jgi:hypothetical protein
VRRAVPFDPAFFTRDARFWPLARAARALLPRDDFPPVDALGAVFVGEPPVRFVAASPRPRRRRRAIDPRALYDARIAVDRQVPTRERCWHDLMNALVWGTFPLAKNALHARQHRAIQDRLGADAHRLPATRTPELDALALLDEGGVVLFTAPSAADGHGPCDCDCGCDDDGVAGADRALPSVIFGHAIYESLLFGVAPAVAAAIALPAPSPGARAGDGLLALADRALAAVLRDPIRLRRPSDLRRVRIEPSVRRLTSDATGPAAFPSSA